MTAIRKILLAQGMIGHNWDFSFPILIEHFRKITLFSNYTWVDHSLGFVPTMNLSQYVPNNTLVSLTTFFQPVTIVKILLIAVITISFISYRTLLDNLLTKDQANSYFALLYAFSPFLFNEIIGGSWYMWVSYASCPFLFYGMKKVILDKQYVFIPLSLFASYFAIASLQNFVCVISILSIYAISHCMQERKIWGVVSRGMLLGSILLLGHSFWLLNLSSTFDQFSNDVITNNTFAGSFSGVRNSTHNLSAIMNLTAYLDRNLYYYVIPSWGIELFSIAVGSLWGFILLSLVRNKSRTTMHRGLMLWIAIWALGVFVVKGGNLPLPNLTMHLFTKLPMMKLFRSPQHLMFIPAFITPLLLALAYRSYAPRLRKQILPLLIIGIVIWTSGWFFTGDLGAQTLGRQKRDHVDIFSLSPGLERAYRDIEKADGNGRVLFIPPVNSPLYLPTEYQRAAQGGVPEYPYLAKATISSEQIRDVEMFESMFCGGKQVDTLGFIKRYAIHQIIVRKDIQSLFSHCERIFDHKKAISYLDSLPYLRKEILDTYVIRYSVEKKYRREILTAVTSRGTDKDQKVSYQKISPVEYTVLITGAKDPLTLTLLTNFNRNWGLYSPDLNKVVRVGVEHAKGEGYANTWTINPKTICNAYSELRCVHNPDSSVSFSLKIYFSQQSLLKAGLFVSKITLVFLILWYIWYTKIRSPL